MQADAWLPPLGYAVLARNAEPSANGGVTALYRYSGINLGNGDDTLILLAPDGREMDRVMWGGTSGLRAPAARAWSASQALPAGRPPSASGRARPAIAAARPAQCIWTHADPGGEASRRPRPEVHLLLTPGASPTPGAWPLASSPSDLRIDEVLYAGGDEEFIALANLGATSLSLAGWAVG